MDVAPDEIIGTCDDVTCLNVFFTTELDGGPTTTDGSLASTDCADDVFWSAWSASEVSAETISMSLPSRPR